MTPIALSSHRILPLEEAGNHFVLTHSTIVYSETFLKKFSLRINTSLFVSYTVIWQSRV